MKNRDNVLFVPMVKYILQECCHLLFDLQCCHHNLEEVLPPPPGGAEGFTFNRLAMLWAVHFHFLRLMWQNQRSLTRFFKNVFRGKKRQNNYFKEIIPYQIITTPMHLSYDPEILLSVYYAFMGPMISLYRDMSMTIEFAIVLLRFFFVDLANTKFARPK